MVNVDLVVVPQLFTGDQKSYRVEVAEVIDVICDYCPFSKLKNLLEGRQFHRMEDIKMNEIHFNTWIQKILIGTVKKLLQEYCFSEGEVLDIKEKDIKEKHL